MTALQLFSVIIIYTTVGSAISNMVLYHVLTRGECWRSPMGLHLMAISAVDGAIFTIALAALWWPQVAAQAWYQWLYLVAVAGIPAVNVWRSVILWRLYHPPGGVYAPSKPRAPRSAWLRRRVARPLMVWQTVLAGAQVVNGVLLGYAGWKATLLLGAMQLAVACYSHGRDVGATPSPVTSPATSP